VRFFGGTRRPSWRQRRRTRVVFSHHASAHGDPCGVPAPAGTSRREDPPGTTAGPPCRLSALAGRAATWTGAGRRPDTLGRSGRPRTAPRPRRCFTAAVRGQSFPAQLLTTCPRRGPGRPRLRFKSAVLPLEPLQALGVVGFQVAVVVLQAVLGRLGDLEVAVDFLD